MEQQPGPVGHLHIAVAGLVQLFGPMLTLAIWSDFLRRVLLSFGCGIDHPPKQTFGQFLQNGSKGSARLISMELAVCRGRQASDPESY
jgi:hypothetical protein